MAKTRFRDIPRNQYGKIEQKNLLAWKRQRKKEDEEEKHQAENRKEKQRNPSPGLFGGLFGGVQQRPQQRVVYVEVKKRKRRTQQPRVRRPGLEDYAMGFI